jgi:ketosteroid isomerase-like protein
VAADYAADGVFAHPIEPPALGPAAVKELVARSARRFRALRFELHRLYVEGDAAAFEWTMYLARRDKEIVVPGATFVELRDGKIVRWQDYWDTATFLRQLG